MEIKEIKDFQMKEALELVWKVFLEFEAPDYTKEGIAEFKKTIDDKTWIEKRKFIGADRLAKTLLDPKERHF